MKKKVFAALAGSVILLMLSAPLFAHHAGSLYDREHPVTLTGTVTKYLMINPHAQVHFEVKDENGNVATWVAETAGPQRLLRVGWNKNTLKPGDQITVIGQPAKNGSPSMRFLKIVLANGQELDPASGFD